MRKQILVAVSVLILASLSCGTYVTSTPAVSQTAAAIADTATPAPSETHAPTATVSTPAAQAINVSSVVKTNVNIRLHPDGAAVGALREGDMVEVLSCNGGWCEIKLYVWRGCLSGNDDMGCESK